MRRFPLISAVNGGQIGASNHSSVSFPAWFAKVIYSLNQCHVHGCGNL